MLTIESKLAQVGTVAQLEVRQTDGAGGIQFELLYDPAALLFVEWVSAAGADAVINSSPGLFRYVVSSTVPLPEILGHIVFNVMGSSLLEFRAVVAGTPLGQPITVDSVDGEITIAENKMTQPFVWTHTNPAGKIISWKLKESTIDNDPANFTEVASVAGSVLTVSVEVLPDTGTHWYLLEGVDRFSRSTGPSNILSLDTSAPLPAVLSFG